MTPRAGLQRRPRSCAGQHDAVHGHGARTTGFEADDGRPDDRRSTATSGITQAPSAPRWSTAKRRLDHRARRRPARRPRRRPGRARRLHPARRAFGVAPDRRSATRTIVNFNVPAFVYNGRTYTPDRRRLQRLPRRRRRHCRGQRLLQPARRAQTRHGRTTCWRRSGPTSTARERQGILAATLTDGVECLARRRVAGERVRHDRIRRFQTWIGIAGERPGAGHHASPTTRRPTGRPGRAGLPGRGRERARRGRRDELPADRQTSVSPAPTRRPAARRPTPCVARGERVGTGTVTHRDVRREHVPGVTVVEDRHRRHQSGLTAQARPDRRAGSGVRAVSLPTAAWGFSQRNSGSPPWYS